VVIKNSNVTDIYINGGGLAPEPLPPRRAGQYHSILTLQAARSRSCSPHNSVAVCPTQSLIFHHNVILFFRSRPARDGHSVRGVQEDAAIHQEQRSCESRAVVKRAGCACPV